MMKSLFVPALLALLAATAADALSCNSGPFIVFFESDSATIDPEGSSILNATADQAHCADAWWRVKVTGFADRTGTQAHNLALAQRRAKAVVAYLISRGVPARQITTQALGENPSHLRVPTPNGVAEVQNRRVEVVFDFSGGWIPAAPQ